MKYFLLYKKLLLSLIFSGSFMPAFSQFIVRGTASDEKDLPVAGATVSVAGSRMGTISDESGKFSLEILSSDSVRLIISAVGYVPDTVVIFPPKSSAIKIMLRQNQVVLNDVIISAGTFDVIDQKRSGMLKSEDILTTPGTGGDLYAAVNLLPGAQVIGEQDVLFVRGGSNLETKTYIDGMLAPHPFLSTLPGIKQKSRYSPYLFKGTYFNSGGYSAPYGQALSSVLILESFDLPDSTTTRFDISLADVSVTHNHRWANSSLGGSVEYANQALMNEINNSRPDWKKNPEHGGLDLFFRNRN